MTQLFLMTMTLWVSLSPIIENGEDFLRMYLPVKAQQFLDAELYSRQGSLIVYIPDLFLEQDILSIDKGPIHRIKIKKAPHGTSIILSSENFLDLKNLLRLQNGAKPYLEIHRPRAIPASNAVHLSHLQDIAAIQTLQTTEAASSQAQAIPVAHNNNSTGQGTLASDPLYGQGDLHQARWPEHIGATSKDHTTSLWLVSFLLLMMSSVAFWLWWKNQQQLQQKGDVGIDVLAMKHLSGKIRLALIETCGERMLLAASDKEVQLLSHMAAATESTSLPSAPSVTTSYETHAAYINPMAAPPMEKATHHGASSAAQKPQVPRPHNLYQVATERSSLVQSLTQSIEHLIDKAASQASRTPSGPGDIQGLLQLQQNDGFSSEGITR